MRGAASVKNLYRASRHPPRQARNPYVITSGQLAVRSKLLSMASGFIDSGGLNEI